MKAHHWILILISCTSSALAQHQTDRNGTSEQLRLQKPRVIQVSHTEYLDIKHHLEDKGFRTWVRPYAGVVTTRVTVQPFVLIGGAWGRARVSVVSDDPNDPELIGVPVDYDFFSEHWAAASAAGRITEAGRFGWTFGVSVGSLQKATGGADDTDSSTNYFLGLTYRVNPQFMVSIGGVAFQSDGHTVLRPGLGVSIDVATIGKIFGG